MIFSTLSSAHAVFPPLAERPVKNTIVLFDVDGTLTPARERVSPEMTEMLTQLRHKVAIGFVGGSDLPKQQEQLGSSDRSILDMFDFCFSENGVTAYKLGQELKQNSFIEFVGEEKYQKLLKVLLHYLADLSLPKKRGTFVEYRRGMINVSPIGRNASPAERIEYENFDKANGIREKLVQHLKESLPDIGLTYSIGGQISIDIFPTGWDKTFALSRLEEDASQPGGITYTTVHFFGDKSFKGGNDFEIYHDERTIGHAIKSPEETMAQVKKLFF